MRKIKKVKRKQFKRVLVANRGEIALRIMQSLREMGIESVAIYSDEDLKSPHVFNADVSKRVGGAPSRESYLNIDKIIKVAKESKADAIHPGYGFLAENPNFVSACDKNGIVFIGPNQKAIKLIGDKIESRILMKKAGVPIIPGTTEGVSPKDAKKMAKKIGYPILLKATAGGGGKGMRKVNGEKEIGEAYRLASSEAAKSFGNPILYIEKFIENPRHVEVQILVDLYGNVTHVYNRECSIQRRHQKIVEEAPAPNLSSKTANKMFSVAVEAAKAIGYTNAGTVEFIVDSKENFYFLEMNTRLQVEHPVTEMVTGLDLVKEQIRIASGGKLLDGCELPQPRGSSIECRIYAEDPENNFAPSPGEISYLKNPQGPFIRIDSGIWTGSNISLYYDPLIAKLVCWGRTRDEAVLRMRRALNEYKITGIKTNIPFLKWVVSRERFLKGKLNTNFIDDEGPYKPKSASKEEIHVGLAALVKYDLLRRTSRRWDEILGKEERKLAPWRYSFLFEGKT